MKTKTTFLKQLFLLLILFSSSIEAQDLSTLISEGSYYIDNVGANRRLKSNNADTDAITANTTDTGWRGYWEFIDAGNGEVYIQNIANGMRLQGLSNSFGDESAVRIGAATFAGTWVKWKLTKTGNNWTVDNVGHNSRLTVNSNSEIAFGNTAFGAEFSQWRITNIQDEQVVTDFRVQSHSPAASNATHLGTNEGITLTFNDEINVREASNIDVFVNKTLSNNNVSWNSPSATQLSVNHNSEWSPGDLITILINQSLESEAGIRYASSVVEYEFIVDTPENFGLERIRIEPLVTRNNGAHDVPLQVALPTNRSSKVPVHIWVHGGGWSGGSAAASNTATSPHSNYLSEELGIATLEIAYRTIGSNGTFTLALEDIESAYEWVIDNASRYNFDLDKIFFSGGSAGTPLASLFSQRHSDVKAFVGFNGIYNFSQNPGSSFPFGGSSVYEFCEPSCAANSSIFNLRNNPPATLLLHGDNDSTINHTQSTLFATAVNNAGGNARAVIYPGERHAFFNTGQVQFEDCLWEMSNFLIDNNLTQLDNGVVLSERFYIDNVGANKRLKSNNADTDVVTANTTDTGWRGYWELIDAGNGEVYIQNIANGMRLQGLSNSFGNESAVRVGASSFTGTWVKWKLTKVGNNWLIDNVGHNTRLTINSNSEISFGNTAFGAAFSQWTITSIHDENQSYEASLASKDLNTTNELENTGVQLNLYPNPLKSGTSLSLDYYANIEGDMEIRISNIVGSTMFSKKTTADMGFNSYIIPTDQLVTGVYFVELISNGEKIVTKKMLID